MLCNIVLPCSFKGTLGYGTTKLSVADTVARLYVSVQVSAKTEPFITMLASPWLRVQLDMLTEDR